MSSWWVGLPEGVPVPVVRRALAKLMQRHEALRTVYRRGEDGLPVQVVLDGVEPRLILVDLGKGGASDEWCTDELDEWLEDQVPPRFDLANETSFTAVAAVRGGAVYRLHAAVHRIAVDGVAWGLLRDESRELIRAAGSADEPSAPAWQPIDQALAEAADKARGAAERTALFWESELAHGPHTSLPVYWDGDGEPSYLTSVSVDRAKLEAIAQRCKKATMPTVLQALLAVMCAGWTGHPCCAIGSVTANRVQKRLRSSVGRYASTARVVLDVRPEATFDDFVRAAHRKLVLAYLHGPHDVGEMAMREVRHSSRLGGRITNSIFFEYHYYAESGDGLAEVPAPRTPDGFRQVEAAEYVPQLWFDVVPSKTDVELMVRCPRRLLGAVGATEFLGQFRDLVDLAAADDQVVAGLLERVRLPAPWEVGNWASIHQSWVNLDDVARLVEKHPAVATATISVESGDDGVGRRLVAEVVTRSAALSVSVLDAHMRDVVSRQPSAMVPHRYLIRVDGASLPPDGASGTGGPEAVLVNVFRACHHGRSPRLTDTYAANGGDLLRIPEMVKGLEQAGLGGVSWDDFIGFAPMGTIAAKLA